MTEPYSVVLKPNSIVTAQTTATDVVDSATPASRRLRVPGELS
jgi:uncharacterized protein with FMN-binding domain